MATDALASGAEPRGTTITFDGHGSQGLLRAWSLACLQHHWEAADWIRTVGCTALVRGHELGGPHVGCELELSRTLLARHLCGVQRKTTAADEHISTSANGGGIAIRGTGDATVVRTSGLKSLARNLSSRGRRQSGCGQINRVTSPPLRTAAQLPRRQSLQVLWRQERSVHKGRSSLLGVPLIGS